MHGQDPKRMGKRRGKYQSPGDEHDYTDVQIHNRDSHMHEDYHDEIISHVHHEKDGE